MHLFPGLKILDYSKPMELENKDKIKPGEFKMNYNMHMSGLHTVVSSFQCIIELL